MPLGASSPDARGAQASASLHAVWTIARLPSPIASPIDRSSSSLGSPGAPGLLSGRSRPMLVGLLPTTADRALAAAAREAS